MPVWVKICGVTSVADAELCVEAGADAIGLNFVPSSPRYIQPAVGREIRDRLEGSVELVAVVADLPETELRQLQLEVEPDYLQLHGNEPPELLERFLPSAYKVVHVQSATDLERVNLYGGERVLLDAKVAGKLGGTGTAFDYSLTTDLARRRRVILAGGLKPETVASAVAQVKPFGVDVASGVENPGQPRSKAADKVRAFVKAAKEAG